MEPINQQTLTEFLTRLGERYTDQATLYLLGGCALLLLGNLRQTMDIDYTTDLNSQQQQSLETIMNELAAQYRIVVDAVPIAEFVPLPPGAEARRHFIGRFAACGTSRYHSRRIPAVFSGFARQVSRGINQ